MKTAFIPLYWRLIGESMRFAWSALIVNRLRTLLSLLGITIGIFAMISVFTLVDTMEQRLRNSVDSLGSDVVFVQKWPWAPEPGDTEYAWWRYWQRPDPTLHESDVLQNRLEKASAVAFVGQTNKTVKYLNNSMENSTVQGVSHRYSEVRTLHLKLGRYFTRSESLGGSPIGLIGANVAEALFGMQNPLGRTVKIAGHKITVVGVFKKEGESLVGNSLDNFVLLPIQCMRNLFDLNRVETYIMVKAGEGVENEEMKSELTALMRGIRRLRPKEDNDFALNESSLISSALDELFAFVHKAGMIIGGFSIVVGGFGIANIMFVSVRERTSLIGIQKSLGAKNYFVLLQFLFEAVALCLIGGAAGLLLIFLGGLIVTQLFDFSIVLSLTNVLRGILFSVAIGLVSGIVPAFRASKLNPVVAIRSGYQ